ncbi:putative Tubulin delta chain [Paratrimastix pyriformis]|uniref:Tubulin delta chain n=1 Tax=Paratrimastix pyriformis TaxID=342808 RepID=A0ABQ8UUL6_9EUKA|nr:putative Tubulin delta chain [Paratrimastix pyriformis]
MKGGEVVTLQLGQYGNQVGFEIFNTMAHELFATSAPSSSWLSFFRYDTRNRPTARCVLVDMEPKVINQSISLAESSKLWVYDASQSFSKQSGSGNNWANGYLHHGPSIRDRFLSMVRREAEQCDRLSTFLLLQSLAGGTGSGVGTYLTEVLRDEYPNAILANQVAWPYGTGDVVVQTYNAAFTLAHLNQTSDAILTHQNDHLNSICTRLLHISQPSFTHLNKVIAGLTAGVALPASVLCGGCPPTSSPAPSPFGMSTMGPGGYPPAPVCSAVADYLCTVPRSSLVTGLPAAGAIGGGASVSRQVTSVGGITICVPVRLPSPRPPTPSALAAASSSVAPPALALSPVTALADSLGHLCGHPGFRLLTTRSVPQVPDRSVDYTADSWPALLRPLHSMLAGDLATEDRIRAGTADLSNPGRVCRCLSAALFLRGQQYQAVDGAAFQGALQPFGDPRLYAPWALDPLRIYLSPARFRRLETFAAVVANSQSVVGPLEHVLGRAQGMYAARAFLHHYARYGVEEDHFRECFAELEQVLANYRSL